MLTLIPFSFNTVNVLPIKNMFTSQSSVTNFSKRRVENLSASFFKGNISAKVGKGFGTDDVIFLAAENFEYCVDFGVCF